MRKAFIETLIKLAEKDKNIYLLTGDLGFSVLEPFSRRFPKRFINCGVAEQNMMGLAAGLALSGKKPYVYSIIPFVTMRCFEQIRNDVCYQNLDVKIVGVGSGLAYGPLGPTHHAIEDIGTLRTLPNMIILSPADPVETKELTLQSYQRKSPTYLRLHKSGEKILYRFPQKIEIGKPSILKEGKDGLIIATGILVNLCLEVVEELRKNDYNFRLISLHTLKPIEKKEILKAITGFKLIFTVEEHNVFGGLGSAMAEILAESNYEGHFERIGIPDKYCSEVGGTDYLRGLFGLAKGEICKKILEKLKNK